MAVVTDRVDPSRAEHLLLRLLEQYSPSFSEEPAMSVIADALHDAEISYLRQPVTGREYGIDDGNLIVELGPSPPELLWVGHVDTVPPADDDLLTPRLEGDVLHGLGAADMKSGCAAALEAIVAVKEAGIPLRRGVAVAFVVGEEEAGDGSLALAERWDAPLVVIGEPTGNLPATKHYGYYEHRLTCEGSRVHAALPELGGNAIHAMLVWLTEIIERAKSAHPERLAINPREIGGGGDLFVVAERCESHLDVHAAPEIGPERVQEIITAASRSASEAHERCTFGHELLFDAPGYTLPDEGALTAVRRAYDHVGLTWQPATFRSHSDAPIFQSRGATTIVCGPGRLEVAHTRNEHVSLSEVVSAARLYAAMIAAVCG